MKIIIRAVIASALFLTLPATAIDIKKIQLTNEEAKQLTDEEIAERIEYLVEVSDPRSDGERSSDIEMRKKYDDTLMIDALVVGVPGFEGIGFTAEQFDALATHYIDTHMDAFNTTATNGSEGAAPVFERLQKTREWIETNSDRNAFFQNFTNSL